MIKEIKEAAESVGITAVITNSDEKIETQLNRITGKEQLPIMLISWNIVTDLTINSHGFFNNPSSSITCLLMDKSKTTEKIYAEETAENMAELYKMFILNLNTILAKYQLENAPSLSGISYTLLPWYGIGKHSGVLGRFIMKSSIINCDKEDGGEEPVDPTLEYFRASNIDITADNVEIHISEIQI